MPNYMVIPSDISSDLILIQMLFHLVTLVGLINIFPLIIINERGKVVDFLLKSNSATDFTVMVDGLPQNYSPDELRVHMQLLLRDRETPVAAIVPTYDMKEFSKLDKKLKKLREMLYMIDSQIEIKNKCCRRKNKLDSKTIKEEIKKCENQQKQLKNNFNLKNQGNLRAFVTFKTIQDAKEILEHFELSLYQTIWKWLQFKRKKPTKHSFNGHFLQFFRPPHPSDINWDNLSIKSTTKIKSRLLTYVVSALILGLGGFLLYILRRYQHSEESSTLTLLPSVLILGINLALEIVMAIITEYELHSSYTNYKVNVARKLIVLMFMNTAVIPTVVNSYIVDGKDEWFEPGGLCSDVYTIIMINAICPPLFYLYIFNPLYLIFLGQSYFFRKSVEKGARVTQEQANKSLTPIEFDLAERYAQIIKTVYVGVFFSPLVPMSILFSMIGVVLEYVVTKYMLNKHPVPRVHNERLVLEMFEWLRYSICVYAIGVAFFYFEIDGNTSDNYSWDKVVYTALATALLGLYYFIIPVNHSLNKNLYKDLKNKMISEMNSKIHDHTRSIMDRIESQNEYNQYRLLLDTDFERANPAIRDQALRKFEDDKRSSSEYILEDNENPRKWAADPNSLLENISIYNSIVYFGSFSVNPNQGYQEPAQNQA